MNDYVLTESGASWLASRIAGKAPNINVIYVVYDNSTKTHTEINATITASDLLTTSETTGVMRSTKNISVHTKSDDSGNKYAVVYGVVSNADVLGSPDLTAGESKIITIAVGHTSDTGNPADDIIIAACNITISGVYQPVPWVDNMSIAVSCPIQISATKPGN